MLNRSKLLAFALLATMFVVGGVVGMAASTAWAGPERDGRRGDRPRQSFPDWLGGKLQLDETQRDSVRIIVDRREQAMRQIWREMRPRFDSIQDQIRIEIMDVLDSAQQAKFTEMNRKSDSARAAREQNRGSHDRRR